MRPDASWLVCAALSSTLACVAPIRTDGPAAPPDDHTYVGRHGRPLAYGGGVCPVESRHLHPYPPVPRAAFVDEQGAARDTRPIVAFFDPHPHAGRTCVMFGLHYHLQEDVTSVGGAPFPPSELVWSEEKGAWRSVKSVDALLGM